MISVWQTRHDAARNARESRFKFGIAACARRFKPQAYEEYWTDAIEGDVAD